MSKGSRERRGLPQRVKMRHDTHFVEDLTVGHETPVGRMVSIHDLDTDPEQPRGSLGDLDQLAASIQSKGILEPLLVRANPKSAGEKGAAKPYRIISGERRFLAALEAGLLEVPVIEMEVSEQEALEIALVENLQRKDLTPFEEGDGFRRLAEEYGYTHEQIAAAVGKSRSLVTETLAIAEMPPRARDAAMALGLTSKSLLVEVVKAAEAENEIIELLERIAEQGLSRDDLRAAARRTSPRRARPGDRRKPYTFTFKAPDKTFNLSMSFRRSTVDRKDLISALEQILDQLRTKQDSV